MIKRYIEIANKFLEENRYSGVAVALVCYLLVVLFCFTSAYERFELNLFDLRFKLRPSIAEWNRLYFLDVDENSITIEGQYPWPRDLYAKGLKTLKDVGAAQAGFDMMFLDESPRTLDDKSFDTLAEKAGPEGRITLAELDAAGFNNDKIFAESIADMGQVVLSYTFNNEPPNYDVLLRQKKASFRKARARFIERSSVKIGPDRVKQCESLIDASVKSISYPIPDMMNTARAFGFVNRDTDIDGTVRKVRLVQAFEGRLFFNLALIMLADTCGVSLKNIDVEPGKRITLKNAIDPGTKAVEDIIIPIDDHGMLYVTWAGSGQGKGGRREKTFRLVSFYAVLEYRAPSAYDKKKSIAEYVRGLFELEDQIKADQLGALNEQVEIFSEELGGAADPAMKKNLEASVNELKKQIAALSENPFLSTLEAQMGQVRAEFEAAPRGEAKQNKWKEVLELRKLMNRTKLEYLRNYDLEISAQEKALQKMKKKDEKAEARLKKLKYDRQAMDLVIRVQDLADRVVLIGLTATGTQDIGAIPLFNEYARVGTYHNTINTIVQGEFINKVKWPVNFLLMLATAIAMGFVIQRLNAKRSMVTMVLTFLVLNVAVMMAFAFFNLWLQQVGIALSMFLPTIAIVAIKFVKEESQKRFIKNAFSFYLSPSVIDEIIKDPESLELGGEDREITIFFSDIKSFSTISEKLSPQDLVKRLNEYLTEMTDIVLKYNGTVDKYIGDAIMAFYGAPVAMPDHPVKACLAAVDMKKRLRELQEKWRNEGVEPIFARMGIHSGKATVGNMGSRTRMDYTVMGDAVNLASRLEGANKSFNTSAMISGSTYEAAKERIDGRQLGKIRVVGKKEAVPIYELLGAKGSLPDYMYEMLEKYNQGRAHFIKRDWKQAISSFKQAAKVVPDDGPSKIYIEKCEEYMKTPPPRGWDGVFVLKQK
ncbi:MAG: CHASE2 domain-containing protein [Spirochaetes bacterium]|nr:CHASE2 domain-containing protein [Spirochaetota bacterium]